MLLIRSRGVLQLIQEPGSTHCSHAFHARCIIRYWDEDRKFKFTCPNCRHSAGKVRDRVTFEGEKEDWVPNISEVYARDAYIAEIREASIQSPNLDIRTTGHEFELAWSREMEKNKIEKGLDANEATDTNIP